MTLSELMTLLREVGGDLKAYTDRKDGEIALKAEFRERTMGIEGAFSKAVGYDVPFDTRSAVVSGFENCMDFLKKCSSRESAEKWSL